MDLDVSTNAPIVCMDSAAKTDIVLVYKVITVLDVQASVTSAARMACAIVITAIVPVEMGIITTIVQPRVIQIA